MMNIKERAVALYEKTPLPEIKSAMRAGKYIFSKGLGIKSKESVSYIKTRFGYMATYKLYVQDGSGNRITTNQLIDLMPIDVPEDIKIRFSTRERTLRGKGRDKLIDNGENWLYAVSDFTKKRGINDGSDEVSEDMKSDINLYGGIRRYKENPLIIYDWTLTVKSKNQESIDEFIKDINKAYSKNRAYQGIEWQTIPSKQKELWGGLFGKINLYNASRKIVNTQTVRYHSSVAYKYARMNTTFSRGLKYDKGIVVGNDVASPISETARVDFLNIIKKRGIVAIEPDRGNYEDIRPSSVLLQTIANHFASANVPTIHIVMNGFDYINTNTYLDLVDENAKYDVRNFERVLMNEHPINPIEGYSLQGEEITMVFDRLTQKVANMIKIMLNHNIPEGGETEILSIVSEFYRENKKWNTQGLENGSIQISNITDHSTYITFGDIVGSITAQMQNSKMLEDQKKRYQIINTALKTSLTSQLKTIGRTSSIEPPTALQTYYDFSYLDGTTRDLELLNVLDFVMYHARERGANVMIHGMDSVDRRMVSMMSPFKDYADQYDIPVIIGMDNILEKKNGNETIVGIDSLANTWYNDLTDADLLVFSRLKKEGFSVLEGLLNQKFSETTKDIMGEDVNYLYYSIYKDRNSGIVVGEPMI